MILCLSLLLSNKYWLNSQPCPKDRLGALRETHLDYTWNLSSRNFHESPRASPLFFSLEKNKGYNRFPRDQWIWDLWELNRGRSILRFLPAQSLCSTQSLRTALYEIKGLFPLNCWAKHHGIMVRHCQEVIFYMYVFPLHLIKKFHDFF